MKSQSNEIQNQQKIFIPSSHQIIPQNKYFNQLQLQNQLKFDDNSLYQKMNNLVSELNELTSINIKDKKGPQIKQQKNLSDKYTSKQSKIAVGRLRYSRICRLVDSLKQATRLLISQISKENRINQIVLQKFGKDIVNFFNNQVNPDEITFNIGQQSLTKNSLKSKLINIQKIQKQNFHLKKQIEQIKKNKNIINNELQTQYIRIKQLQNKLNKYHIIIQDKDKIIQSLSIQNDQLHQIIFDYQQRIVGVDLEVQKKVQELSIRGDGNKKNQYYLNKIQQLTKQIEDLSQKYQLTNLQKNQQQSILRRKQKQLQIKQKQLYRKQQQIYSRWQQLDRLQQKYYKKQSELFKKQQQIDIKFRDINIKENQLEIIKHQLNQNYKSFNNHQRMLDNSRRIKQYTINIPPTNTMRHQGIFKYSQVGREQRGLDRDDRSSQVGRSKQSKIRSKPQSIQKDHQTATFNKKNSQISPRFPLSKQFFQRTGQLSTPKKQEWNPPITNKYHTSLVGSVKQTSSSNLIGIQSKLQKLKQQIRKQIDSIK